MKVKMSQILMEADQSQQVKHAFTVDWDAKTEKAKGYCAVGKIACETKNIDGGYVGSEMILFERLKIPKKFRHMDIICKLCARVKKPELALGYHRNNPWGGKLPSYIIHMNDDHDKTFKYIGRYLKKLGL